MDYNFLFENSGAPVKWITAVWTRRVRMEALVPMENANVDGIITDCNAKKVSQYDFPRESVNVSSQL